MGWTKAVTAGRAQYIDMVEVAKRKRLVLQSGEQREPV